MTKVTIHCPRCGTECAVPLDSLLVVSVIDDQDPELAAIIGWLCSNCGDLTDIAIDWTGLLTLVTEGAMLLAADDGEETVLPPHPEAPAGGPAFTADDELALHEALAADSWFDGLIARTCE